MFRGTKQTKREGTDGGGEDIEKLELPEVMRRGDTHGAMLPPTLHPQRSHHLRRHRPAGGTRCRDLAGPNIPRGLGAWRPVLPASCCVHTPTSRAAFSGEPGGPAKALGGKSLP